MKTLIILKGLAKNEKLEWVKSQGLENFFLDYSIFKRLYSMPELDRDKTTDILGRTNINLIFKSWFEAINNKLESGCLVVIDYDQEKTKILEDMGMIYGYTCFYKIFNIPHDYTSNPEKYSPVGFKRKTKEELEAEVITFLNLQLGYTKKIGGYSDVTDYWKKKEVILDIPRKETMYFFSDLHSNYSLYQKINLPSGTIRVHLGDYIDGPEEGGSRKLIEMIFKNASHYNIFLEGNHERRLRKFLFWRWAASSNSGGSRAIIAEMLYNSLPTDFLTTTADEFRSLIPGEALTWLKRLNDILRTHIIIKKDDTVFYCTHAGIKYLEQLSPKFIGNVIYGNRDMDIYDKCFSKTIWKPTGRWSVHAHCRYPYGVDFLKYDGVVNLDPSCEKEIVYMENNIKNFLPCIVQ